MRQGKGLSAKTPFSGVFEVPDGTVTQKSTVEDLMKAGFTRNSSLSKFYDLDTLRFSFFAEVGEEAGGALLSLSLEFAL